jgi:hypothetical protein
MAGAGALHPTHREQHRRDRLTELSMTHCDVLRGSVNSHQTATRAPSPSTGIGWYIRSRDVTTKNREFSRRM